MLFGIGFKVLESSNEASENFITLLDAVKLNLKAPVLVPMVGGDFHSQLGSSNGMVWGVWSVGFGEL